MSNENILEENKKLIKENMDLRKQLNKANALILAIKKICINK